MDRQADFKQNAIVFMTNGILLQRLVHDKNFLRQIHYLILDEVHERDIDSDFIMVALKHLLATNPRVRIVLMSATINN
jgi:HrpA-like RNA helicase